MNKIIVETYYSETVEDLMKKLQFIDRQAMPLLVDSPNGLEVGFRYPDDALSSEFYLWLGLVKLSGLIEDYRFERGSTRPGVITF